MSLGMKKDWSAEKDDSHSQALPEQLWFSCFIARGAKIFLCIKDLAIKEV